MARKAAAIRMKELVIPDGVREIKPFAYKDGEDIISVTIPASVETIGEYAFHGCKRLLSFHVSPDNPVFWGDGDLYSKDKTLLVRACPAWDPEEVYEILPGVRRIAPGAVADNTAAKIVLPESVKEIGNFAFENCPNIKKIELSAHVEKIGRLVFKGCKSLEDIFVCPDNAFYSNGGNGALYDKAETMLLCVPESMEVLNPLPDTVTAIDNHAFDGCTRLHTIFCFEEQEALVRKAVVGLWPRPHVAVLEDDFFIKDE